MSIDENVNNTGAMPQNGHYLNGEPISKAWREYQVENICYEQERQYKRFNEILENKNLGEEQLEKITKAYFHPLVQSLASTREESAYHNESSVLEHTLDVFEHVVDNTKEADLDLYVAALFHDVGKILTMEEKNGQTRAIKHDKKGEDILNAKKDELYNICDEPDRVISLAGFHMSPLNLYNSINDSKNPEKSINKHLNKWGNYKEDILLLSEADICKSDRYQDIKSFYDKKLR